MRRLHALFSVLSILLGAALLLAGCSERASNAPEADAEGVALDEMSDQEVLRLYRRVWRMHTAVFHGKFLGIRTLQNPLDAWIVQEILSEVKPDLMIETGTYHGGSAILWAMTLRELNPSSRVVTIDIEDRRERAAVEHPVARERVDFLLGGSTTPEMVADVRQRANGKKVVVLLDSLHTAEHIYDELNAYADLVPVGSYVIVQDTGHGGSLGVIKFLAENLNFEVDRRRERFLITNTRGGYLRRVR